MMSFDTQNRATGSRDAATRESSPKITTARPDSQTKARTVGTLRSADSRSRHPRQNSGFSFMAEFNLRRSARGSSDRRRSVGARNRTQGLNIVADTQTRNESIPGKQKPAYLCLQTNLG